MISKRSYRNIQVLLAFITLFVLMASFYFQYVLDMQPCPLCIMQRVMVLILLFLTLVGVRLGTVARAKLIAIAQMLFSIGGLYFSGRQLWLQSQPPEAAPACLPGLDILMKYFPIQDVIHALIWGAADCAEVSWQWLGVSMPGWSLLYFLSMLFGSGFIYWRLSSGDIS